MQRLPPLHVDTVRERSRTRSCRCCPQEGWRGVMLSPLRIRSALAYLSVGRPISFIFGRSMFAGVGGEVLCGGWAQAERLYAER